MRKLDIRHFSDKDSKRSEYRELYETLPFIEAYAKHTDMRIAKDGPELAIGAKRDGQQDWDIHGKAQLQFLIGRGMHKMCRLLYVGCGTGRLAEQAVPMLSLYGYVGIDISETAIKCVSEREWRYKEPQFIHGDGTLAALAGQKFDFVWAHSVFTHLPPEAVSAIFQDLSKMDFGQFFFTYKQGEDNARTGLKQFAYSVKWLIKTAAEYGLKVSSDPMVWPAGQRTMKCSKV